MTNIQFIDEMKTTERVKLSFWNSINHYLIVLFTFIPLILSIYNYFKFYLTNSYTGVKTPSEMLVVSIPFTIAGIFFYYIQYKRLKFITLKTNLSQNKIQEIVSETAKQLEWIKITKSVDLTIFKTFPNWSTGSWGEQITIIINDDKVLINSICDPDKTSSIASFGRNKKNVITLLQNINNAQIHLSK